MYTFGETLAEKRHYSLWIMSQTVEEPDFALSKNRVLLHIYEIKYKNNRFGRGINPLPFPFCKLFKFMVANLSLTQFVTCARPVCGVYLIAYFSFASANTLSIFSFRGLYKSAYSDVWRISPAFSYLFYVIKNGQTFPFRLSCIDRTILPVHFYGIHGKI